MGGTGKHSGYTYGGARVPVVGRRLSDQPSLEEAKARGAQHEQRLAELEARVRVRKTENSLSQHRHRWRAEAMQLKKAQKDLEAELSGVVAKLPTFVAEEVGEDISGSLLQGDKEGLLREVYAVKNVHSHGVEPRHVEAVRNLKQAVERELAKLYNDEDNLVAELAAAKDNIEKGENSFYAHRAVGREVLDQQPTLSSLSSSAQSQHSRSVPGTPLSSCRASPPAASVASRSSRFCPPKTPAGAPRDADAESVATFRTAASSRAAGTLAALEEASWGQFERAKRDAKGSVEHFDDELVGVFEAALKTQLAAVAAAVAQAGCEKPLHPGLSLRDSTGDAASAAGYPQRKRHSAPLLNRIPSGGLKRTASGRLDRTQSGGVAGGAPVHPHPGLQAPADGLLQEGDGSVRLERMQPDGVGLRGDDPPGSPRPEEPVDAVPPEGHARSIPSGQQTTASGLGQPGGAAHPESQEPEDGVSPEGDARSIPTGQQSTASGLEQSGGVAHPESQEAMDGVSPEGDPRCVGSALRRVPSGQQRTASGLEPSGGESQEPGDGYSPEGDARSVGSALRRVPSGTQSTVSGLPPLPPRDAAKLGKILTAHSSLAQPADRGSVVDRLRLEFPGWSDSHARARLHAWERARWQKKKTAAIVHDAEARLGQFFAAFASALETSSAVAAAAAADAAEHARRLRESERQHAVLEALRAEKKLTEAAELERALQEEAAAEVLRKREEDRRNADLAARLNQLEEYRAGKREEAERELEEARALAAVRAEERRRQAEIDAERVAYRSSEFEKKIEMREEACSRRTDEEQRRAAALESLARSAAPDVARDPARAIAPTAASLSVTDPQLINESTVVAVHGYTDQNITRDPRFRLTEALRSANLLHTAYARKVMHDAAPSNRAALGLRTHPDNPMHIPLVPPNPDPSLRH
ncbi:hypothetical protein DIPPA_23621 [Diplonema papillatum]|nr:hypothetical protein DIPPA_23621 [Diplonema papillatum]